MHHLYNVHVHNHYAAQTQTQTHAYESVKVRFDRSVSPHARFCLLWRLSIVFSRASKQQYTYTYTPPNSAQRAPLDRFRNTSCSKHRHIDTRVSNLASACWCGVLALFSPSPRTASPLPANLLRGAFAYRRQL